MSTPYGTGTSGANASGASNSNDQGVYDSLTAILARFHERVEATRNSDHLEDWREQVPEHLSGLDFYPRVRGTTGAEYRVVESRAITIPLELEWQQVVDDSATLSTMEVIAAHGFYARDPHIELSSAIWNGYSYNESTNRLTLAEAAHLAHSLLATIDAAVAVRDEVA